MSKTSPENLHELLVYKLKALYDIEQQLAKTLPKMAKKATDPDLKAGFTEHAEQTKGQIKRLEEAFQSLGEKPVKTKVEAVRGLIADTEAIMKAVTEPAALDVALIASARYAEHYEIAGYDTAIDWAEIMGHEKVMELLEQNLEEEVDTEERLSTLAADGINEAALGEEDEE